MLIPLETLMQKYGVRPTGIIHVGANTGQEAGDYCKNGIQRSIWIEAIPDLFEHLKFNISACPNALALNECVSDVDGQSVDFKITNNDGQSSSMLDLGLHKEMYPQVKVVQTIICTTKKMDTIISENKIDVAEYDFLVMDLQGAELMALHGMREGLNKVKYAYLEVNKEEIYTNCAKVEQIDEFLNGYGFKRIETCWAGGGWGDAFYSKTPTE